MAGARGKRRSPPTVCPAGTEQSNLSDPQPPDLRKSKRHEFRQPTAQAVGMPVGSQLIVGARITNAPATATSWWRTSRRSRLFSPAMTDAGGQRLCQWCRGRMRLPRAASRFCVATVAEGRRQRHDSARPSRVAGEGNWPTVFIRDICSTAKKAGRCTGCASKASSRCSASSRRHRASPISLPASTRCAGEWDLVALAYNCKRLHISRINDRRHVVAFLTTTSRCVNGPIQSTRAEPRRSSDRSKPVLAISCVDRAAGRRQPHHSKPNSDPKVRQRASVA